MSPLCRPPSPVLGVFGGHLWASLFQSSFLFVPTSQQGPRRLLANPMWSLTPACQLAAPLCLDCAVPLVALSNVCSSRASFPNCDL